MADNLWQKYLPRYLTPDEINDILAGFPLPTAVGDKNKRAIANSIREYLYEQLQLYQITPLGIADLKSKMLALYTRSLAIPGQAAGIIASNSVNQPLMQLVLDSFHSSGSGQNVAAGYEAISSLLEGTRIHNPSTSIFFRERLNFREVLNLRQKYVYLTVKDFMQTTAQNIMVYELDTPEEIIGDTVPWWYKAYDNWYSDSPNSQQVNDDEFGVNGLPAKISDVKLMLRLYIDIAKLIKYNVTPDEICNAIQYNEGVANRSVKCIMSPIIRELIDDQDGSYYANRVYIDIYPVEDNVPHPGGNLPQHEIIRLFLFKDVYKSIDKMKIKGITGIKDIFPVKLPVWAMVYAIYKHGDNWLVQFNTKTMRKYGLKRKDFIKLVEYMQMEIIDDEDDNIDTDNLILIKTKKPADFDGAMQIAEGNTRKNISPKQVYDYYNKIDNDERYQYQREHSKKGSELIVRPPSEFENLSQIYYADTIGNNLVNIISEPEVDPYHTYSNDINEILSLYGIESVRNFIIMLTNDIFSGSNQYVDPRHIILIADFMTHIGLITFFNFNGAVTLGDGVITLATFQRAAETIINASGIGTTEQINRISNRTILAQAPRYDEEQLASRIGNKEMAEMIERHGTPQKPKSKATYSQTEINEFLDRYENDEIFSERKVVYKQEDVNDVEFDSDLVGDIADEQEIEAQLQDFSELTTNIESKPDTVNPMQKYAQTSNKVLSDALSNAVSSFTGGTTLPTATPRQSTIQSLRPQTLTNPLTTPTNQPQSSVTLPNSSNVKPAILWSTSPNTPTRLPIISSNISVPNLIDILNEGSRIDLLQYARTSHIQ